MTRGSGRFVLCACLTLLPGCGARTSTLEDELGGQNQGGASGGTPIGGSNGRGGSNPTAGAGGASFAGGSFAGAGGVSFAGAPFGGAGGVHFAGAPSAGAPAAGAPSAGAGGVSFAGSGGISVAGAPFGGFGAVAGAPTAGAGGSIGELCSVLGSSTCEQCVCKSCAPAIEGCFSDLGCAFIFACAQQTGCQNLGCYSPSTCEPVIDQFGGLGGSSMKKVLSLLTCSASSQNSCGCN
jgi:hypothetical protein